MFSFYESEVLIKVYFNNFRMTASEIVMKREDVNIAWGFRLTGGADLGTPFFVVKVSTVERR